MENIQQLPIAISILIVIMNQIFGVRVIHRCGIISTDYKPVFLDFVKAYRKLRCKNVTGYLDDNWINMCHML